MKVVLRVVFFLLIALLMQNCINNDLLTSIQPAGPSSSSVTADWLVFNNRDSFDSSLRKTPAVFPSYFISLCATGNATTGIPGPLAALLNKDSVVQVGKFIYKVSTSTASVFALASTDVAYYNDLLRNNFSSGKIAVYSVHQDVITQAENSSAPYEAMAGTSSQQVLPSQLSYKAGNSTYSIQMQHEYVEAGLCFLLQSEIKNLKTVNNQWVLNTAGYTDLILNYSYVERYTKVAASNTSGDYVEDNNQGEVHIGVKDADKAVGSIKGQLYIGSRGLLRYYLSSTGRYRDNNAESAGGPVPQFTLSSVSN